MAFQTALVAYSIYRSIWSALSGPKGTSVPRIRPAQINDVSLGDTVLPIVYGYNPVDAQNVYHEDITVAEGKEVFQMASVICDGEIESIVKVAVDGIEEDKLLDTADWGKSSLSNAARNAAPNSYTGTIDQTADAIFEAGVFDLKPTKDSYVSRANPTVNYGTGESINISSGTGAYNNIGLLAFDLSALPAGLTISQVYLCLNQTSFSAHLVKGQLFEATGAWTETGVTWNNQPTLVTATPFSTLSLDSSYMDIKGTIFIPFSTAGKADIITKYGAGGTITLGLVADQTSGTKTMAFDSRQGPAAPYLKIKYTGADACAFRETAYYAASVQYGFGKILSMNPQITATVKGKKIRNWDVAGGAWQTTYSRNPVWQILDILTNAKYPMPVADSDINLDSFKAVAVICDASVTRPDGATEARYQCDIVFPNVSDKRSCIQEILSTFGGFVYDQDGTIAIGCEAAESAPYDHSFTTANIIDGTFSMNEIDRETIPNQVKLLFSDVDADFETDHVIAEDNLDIDTRGVKPQEMTLLGIKRRSQAHRMANWYLWKAKLCNQQASFECAWKNVSVNVGDLADVTYAKAGWSAQAVRIMQVDLAQSGNARLTVETYDASIHNDAGLPDDYNTRPNIPKIGLPPDVTSLTLTEDYATLDDGSYTPYIKTVYTWPTMAYPGGIAAKVFWKKDGGAYLLWGEQVQMNGAAANTTYIPVDEGAGTYYVKVQTIGRANGLMSDYDLAPTEDIVIAGAGAVSVPAYMGFTLSTSSKAVWTTGVIVYKGVKYSISAGNTTNRYVYFDPDVSTTVLQTSATIPTLGANGFWFAVYDSATDTVEQAQSFKSLNVDLLKTGIIYSQTINLGILAGAGDCSIRSGKTDFTNTDAGFILGCDDSDSDKAKFYIGSSTKYLNWDGASLTIQGTIQTAASDQRIVINSTDNTIKFYKAGVATAVLIIDDNIGTTYGPGLQCNDGIIWVRNTVTTNDQVYIKSGEFIVQRDGGGTPYQILKIEDTYAQVFALHCVNDATMYADVVMDAKTASRAVYLDANKKLQASAATDTELGYLSGVTSAIQTQLGGKAASAHTHGTYDIQFHVDDHGGTEQIMTFTDGILTGVSPA